VIAAVAGTVVVITAGLWGAGAFSSRPATAPRTAATAKDKASPQAVAATNPPPAPMPAPVVDPTPAGAPPEAAPPPPAAPAIPLGDLLTPAALKERFKGRAIYDAASGELSLAYDFSNSDQLRDFTSDAGKAAVVNRSLVAEPAARVTHVVSFQSFHVTAVLAAAPRKFVCLSTTAANVSIGGQAGHTVYLNVGPNQVKAIVPKDHAKTPTRVEFAVGNGAVSAVFGSHKVGRPEPNVRAGRLTLRGGEKGYTFSDVVISGTVDAEWARDYFGPKPPAADGPAP
jgi:hypothetical protein